MTYTDVLINIHTDPIFQDAFKTYFAELDVQISNWEGLFHEMDESGMNYTYCRKAETGEIIGFIQFTVMEMAGWFFTARVGFIREFWIREDLRGRGHGSELLMLAEDWLRQQSCACVLLTTDTATAFYEKRGYAKEHGIRARNKMDVFLKRL